jgi:hypothetical protein
MKTRVPDERVQGLHQHASEEMSLLGGAHTVSSEQLRNGIVISNEVLGVSCRNVDHYMRFRDQMKVGADGQKRLRRVTRED